MLKAQLYPWLLIKYIVRNPVNQYYYARRLIKQIMFELFFGEIDYGLIM